MIYNKIISIDCKQVKENIVNAIVNSPQTIILEGIDSLSIGKFKIVNVYLTGNNQTFDFKKTGNKFITTVESIQDETYIINANAIDENGEAVEGFILGILRVIGV